MEIATIGLDISKHVFHIHAVDSHGRVTGRLRRGEVISFFSPLVPCLVGVEACATAHYWAREIRLFGHDVRLIPPAYVKPRVRREPRTTPLMQQQSAKPSPGPICDSCLRTRPAAREPETFHVSAYCAPDSGQAEGRLQSGRTANRLGNRD